MGILPALSATLGTKYVFGCSISWFKDDWTVFRDFDKLFGCNVSKFAIVFERSKN